MLNRSFVVISLLAFIGLVACKSPPATDSAQLAAGSVVVSLAEDDYKGRCKALVGSSVEMGTIKDVELVERGDKLIPLIWRVLLWWNDIDVGEFRAPINFCKVTAILRPVSGSEITLEAWLPQQWNGKLFAGGGGGFNGGLFGGQLIMAEPAGKGYVTVVTDAGHENTESAKFAHDNEVQYVDYAHRANHVASVFAKSLAASYYEQPVQRAYFHGCSNGGRDALMEARRYPDDYDGIIAGAPAASWTGLMTSFAWNMQAVDAAPSLNTKLELINRAVMQACDQLDGLEDGLLQNPHACKFDPATLQCSGSEGPDCLSESEVTALRKIYDGPRLSDGTRVYAGVPVGAETLENFDFWISSEEAAQRTFAIESFRWMVHGDPSWDIADFDIDRDFGVARERVAPIMNSDDPDISEFVGAGGKLLMYHGWNDAAIPAGSAIDYYTAMRETVGPKADEMTRLFMVPGMNHCTGGLGPNDFDALGTLDRWVEDGIAPESIVATQYDPPKVFLTLPGAKAVRTRPLCAWPKEARYSGDGSPDDAANFVCELPPAIEGATTID